MTLLFDSEVHSVDRMANLAFYRKTTRKAFDAIVDAVDSAQNYLMYSMQYDDAATMLGVTNEGRDSVLGNLAMTHGSMWSGAGWYRNYGRMYQAGMRGQGINSVGGASTYLLSCVTHSGSSIAGKQKCTWLYKFLMRGTGGAGAGRLSEASASHICFASGANTIAMSIYDGGAWASNTTGATVVYNYWHDLAIVYDGTLAGDVNRCKMYLDGRDVTVNVAPGMPETLVDSSTQLNVLNGFIGGTFSRAFDGILGFFAMAPGVAMSQEQIQSFIEVAGLFQSTPANYLEIKDSPPKYSFDWANSRHLLTYQIQPFLTAAGSIVVFYEAEDFVNEGAILGTYQEGVFGDGLAFETRGDIVNDPIELIGSSGGVTVLRLQHPFGPVNGFGRHCSVMTSDWTTVSGYLDGNLQTLTQVVGANTGQWFASYPLSTVFAVGARIDFAVASGFGGKGIKILVYDRALTQIEIQRICSRGFGPSGPRWYPESYESPDLPH